jgi:hypothetical protein
MNTPVKFELAKLLKEKDINIWLKFILILMVLRIKKMP